MWCDPEPPPCSTCRCAFLRLQTLNDPLSIAHDGIFGGSTLTRQFPPQWAFRHRESHQAAAGGPLRTARKLHV